MRGEDLIDQLREECRQIFEDLPRDRWIIPLDPTLLQFLVDHVVVAGLVGFMSRVAGDAFMNWWRGRKGSLGPTSELRPGSSDLSDELEQVRNELRRVALTVPSKEQLEDARREIREALKPYELREPVVEAVAEEFPQAIADRLPRQ